MAAIATCFEQYQVMGLVVEYVSTCGDAVSSTNSSLGSVSIATQYNVNNNRFANKRQMLQHYFAVSGKPSVNFMHPVECKPDEVAQKLYYVRQQDQVPGAEYDARLYDFGRIEIITEGAQATFVCGELWVSYDIILHKPRQPFSRSLLGITPPGVPPPPPDDVFILVPEIPENCCVPGDAEAKHAGP